jgi:hypothetical protein
LKKPPALAELPELLELPFEPLTLDEEIGVCAADELLLQLYALATFGIIVGAKIIANILAVEMAIPINRVSLFIHVIALSDV